ncbi:MAG: pyrroline-5-carboxylate reductase [Sphingomonadales bacterium]
MQDTSPIALIGCGRMGAAIARALAKEFDVSAYDPFAPMPHGVRRLEALTSDMIPSGATAILAVKPQTLAQLEPDLKKLASKLPLVISVMAGVTIKRLKEVFGKQTNVIRAMPNIAVEVGHGMTVAVSAERLDIIDKANMTRLLETTGRCVWLSKEEQIDAATALSGSGPAYFLRFAEALVEAGVAEGLDRAEAVQLIRQTFIGAARYCEAQKMTLADLRDQVTSANGTTEAGLHTLDQNHAIEKLAIATVEAAARRSRELGSTC